MSRPSKASEPRPGLVVVFSGPSGVGKTTIVREVRRRLGAVFSVSATTRLPTDQDRPGVDYHFLDESTFRRMIDEGEFLEHAEVFGRDLYGTPRAPVEQALSEGRIVILDVDVQGALQLHEYMRDALLIFILPPSEESLLQRLRSRGRDDERTIQRRFADAKREIEWARESGAYDVFIVNARLAEAQDRACEVIRDRLAKQA
jgi:guanylate kinase